MMATANLLRFIVGLLVWLFTTPVVPNSLDASHVRNLCEENQTNPDPLHSSPIKSSPPPSSSSSERKITSNQKPRNNKRKNQKKKKQGVNRPASTSKARENKPSASSI